ncbi:AraC family transcriptional regulator [Zavarzinia aquatilis]|uniref:AraC family transcriptional regulator n=1 Tax=Zavarzinia aquatilis TaxID=2211142 RepID=UPI001A9C8DBC|nr:AraC family transcriptional regulator [Zavarzinia aquatilis]
MPTPDAAPRATPAAFIRAILAAYRGQGRDPAPALARAQIDPAGLAGPGAGVTAAQLEAMAGRAMRELDDEALGWFSRRLPWGSYGLLARGSLTAPDIHTALRRWFRHHALLTDDVSLALEAEGTEARVHLRENQPLGGDADMREFCHVTLLRNAIGFSSWLADSRIALTEAWFPYPAPDHAGAYDLLFGCPTRFGAVDAGVAFDARYLALPVRRDEAAMREMLRNALPLIVLRYKRDRLLLRRAQALLATRPELLANAEALAGALNLSVRSLHRQLAREGTSLQTLKDEARKAEAIRLLDRSNRPVKQIAAQTGFANERSFARAFRGWTGVSPAAWRLGERADKSNEY